MSPRCRRGRRARWAVSAAALLLSLGPCAVGFGQSPAPDDRYASALEQYRRAGEALQAGRAAEALAAAEESLRLVPSPNTTLLKAHALRLLGRRVDAAAVYTEVVREAGKLVRQGDDRYKEALADAGRWQAELRAQLGDIEVSVEGAPQGSVVVSIDGASISVTRSADGRLAGRAWREPGRVTVTVTAPDGSTRRAAVEVEPGATATVRLAFARASAPAAPAPVEPLGPPPVVTWVAWSASGAALGVFAVFGVMAQSAANDLETCSPDCRFDDAHGTADRGSRDATIANVALVVAGGAAIVGGVAWLVDSRTKRNTASARPLLQF
jgi:hypothetical protein